MHVVPRTYLQDRFHAGQMVAAVRQGGAFALGNKSGTQNDSAAVRDSAGSSDDAETRLLEVGRITPVYESLGGTQRLASRWHTPGDLRPARGVDALRGSGVPAPRHAGAAATCPIARSPCGRCIFPRKERRWRNCSRAATPAHRRLIFEELFFLELGLELKRRRVREREGIAFATSDKVREAIREVLPFHPTAAQKRTLGEIVADMRQPAPHAAPAAGRCGVGQDHRGAAGDAGGLENGYQAALMAPTEILATQHYLAARKLLERSSRNYRIVLLTGSLDEDRKRDNRSRSIAGEAQLVIGTHALIEEKVEFDQPGPGGGGRAAPLRRAAAVQADEEAGRRPSPMCW